MLVSQADLCHGSLRRKVLKKVQFSITLIGLKEYDVPRQEAIGYSRLLARLRTRLSLEPERRGKVKTLLDGLCRNQATARVAGDLTIC